MIGDKTDEGVDGVGFVLVGAIATVGFTEGAAIGVGVKSIGTCEFIVGG